MLIFTPPKVTVEIRKFCSGITSDTVPVYVDVKPDTRSVHKECFENVNNFIIENGGSIQYGWRIGEWPKVMLEAEFHAVWRSSDNKFIDITPFEEERILFLPDNSTTYQGKQIDSVRFASTNNNLIHEFIEVNRRIFVEMNKGDLAEKHGAVAVPANIIMPLRQRHKELLGMIYLMTATPNSPCFCRSGRKFKKCCKGYS